MTLEVHEIVRRKVPEGRMMEEKERVLEIMRIRALIRSKGGLGILITNLTQRSVRREWVRVPTILVVVFQPVGWPNRRGTCGQDENLIMKDHMAKDENW